MCIIVQIYIILWGGEDTKLLGGGGTEGPQSVLSNILMFPYLQPQNISLTLTGLFFLILSPGHWC